MEITLSTPFLWDGVSNIVIGVYENAPGFSCTANWQSTNTAANRSMLFYSDGTNPGTTAPPNANYGPSALIPNVQMVITPVSPCAGIPTAGTATGPATVCSGINFSLSLSGYSAASGLTFQWQSSPDGITWTNIPGATAIGYSGTQSAATYYQAIVTCTASGSSASSSSVLVNMSPVASCYCVPTYTNGTGSGDWISLVEIPTTPLNNSTGGAPFPYHTVFPASGSTTATLVSGAPYALNVAGGTYGTCYIAGWGDWNQNGIFEASEFMGVSPNCGATTTVAFPGFTVPLGALAGTTRIRFRSSDTFPGPAATDACGATNSTFGETEDYVVTIQPPPPIDMKATALVAPLLTGCYTATETVTVTIQNSGSNLMDYSVTPVTVNASVSGINPVAFAPVVLNTGTLAVGATQNVVISTTYNMTAVGAYTFDASTSVAGDGNITNDAMPTVTTNVSGGTATAAQASICAGASTTITAAGATAGGTYQWQSSTDGVTWTNIPAATSATYNYTSSSSGATTLYFRNLSCGLHPSTVDTVVSIFVAPATTTGATRCGAGSITLSAAGSGTLNWYTAATGGTPVNTGTTYTTTVPATTTFYVENSAGGGSSSVGKPDNSGFGAQQLSGNYLIFDVLQPFVLQNVTVYPGAAGNVEIELRDNAGALLMSGSYPVTAADVNNPTVITLGWNLTPGTDYRLAQGLAGVSMFRNDGSVTFPYTVPGTVSIHNSAAGLTYYYFFYNWSISTGCGSVRVPVTANVTPADTIIATAVTPSICTNTNTSITVSSINPGYSYTWTPATGLNTTTGDSVVANPGANTTYTISAIDSATGCQTSTTQNIVVNYLPVVNATVDLDTVCPGDTVNLNVAVPTMAQIGTGTIGNTTTTYPAPYGNWYWGARHQFLVLASELTAEGLGAGPINSLAFDVTGVTGTGLQNYTISMAHTAVSSISTWIPGTTPVFTTPSYVPVVGLNTHTFGTPFVWDGTSNIVIETCFNNGAFTTNCVVKQTATSFTSSLWFFQDAAGVCSNNTVSGTMSQRPNMRFTASATYNYSWSPSGDVVNAAADSTAATPSVTTDYIVTVTNPSTGCSASDTVNVYVHAPAVMTLNDTIVCAGGSYTLNAQNPGSTYLWSTAETTQSISITAGGLYYVDITTANGCTSRDSITITLNPQPLVDLGPDAGFCFGDSLLLDAGNTGFDFLWSDGSTSQTLMTYSTGAYYVTVTNPVTGCAITDTNNVTEYALPVIPLGADTAICAGSSLVLDAGTDGDTYTWGGGESSQTITVTTAGTYYAIVVNSVTGCYNTDTINVMINALPVVNLGADTAICAGSTLTLDAGYPGSSYLWNDASSAQTLAVTTAGTYSVALVDTNGCAGSDSINVLINALPVVNLGSDTVQCGGTVMLDAGVWVSYLWNDMSTTQTLGASSTGDYSVMITDVNGCSDSDTINVVINALPVVNLGADSTQCGGGITLDAGNPGFSYLWSNSSTTQTIGVFISGTYGVVVMDSLTGCMASDSINLTINALPLVNIGNDSVQCAGTIVLDAGNPGSSFLWNTMATTQTLTVSTGGMYYVTVTNGSSCSASDTVNLTIHPLPSIGFAPFGAAVCLDATPIILSATPAGGTFFGTGVSGGTFNPAVAGVGTHGITYGVVDFNGCSNSVTQMIDVEDCTGIEEMISQYDVNVYPNPTTGEFTIAVQNANLAQLMISIVDIQGREVFNSMDRNVTGDFVKPISLENISKGIYYIRLTTENDMKIKKLIVH